MDHSPSSFYAMASQSKSLFLYELMKTLSILNIYINARKTHLSSFAMLQRDQNPLLNRSQLTLKSIIIHPYPPPPLQPSKIRSDNEQDQDKFRYNQLDKGYAFVEIEPFPRAKIMKTCYHIMEQLSIGFPVDSIYRIYNEERTKYFMKIVDETTDVEVL